MTNFPIQFEYQPQTGSLCVCMWLHVQKLLGVHYCTHCQLSSADCIVFEMGLSALFQLLACC